MVVRIFCILVSLGLLQELMGKPSDYCKHFFQQIVKHFAAAKNNTLDFRLIQIVDFIHYIMESALGKILNSGNRLFVA